MIIFESFVEALRSIRANPVRSFLTMLGIIIGIASVSMLSGIGEGFKREFSSQIDTLGANLVFVAPGDIEGMTNGSSGFSNFTSSVSSTLSENDIIAIRNIAETKYVTPVQLVGGITRNGDRIAKMTLTAGFSSDVFAIFDNQIDTGRLFTKSDEQEKAQVAVLTKKAKDTLFGEEDPIGKEITIFEKQFSVIGVLKEKEVKSTSQFQTGFDDVVFIPTETAWEVTGSKNIIRIMVQAKDAESITPLKQNIQDALLVKRATKDFSVLTQDDLVGVFDSVFGMLSSAILGITAISLVVGGIGIMNIMLVSVTERTREIGLRKAVGATRSVILFQFLIEAIVLSIFGGAVGYVISIIGGTIASRLLGFTIPVTIESLILAFGVAIGVGVVFGVAPAIRASQKHPIDALRYE